MKVRWSWPRGDRYGPRSLRGQITLLAAVVAALVAVFTLLTVGAGMYLETTPGRFEPPFHGVAAGRPAVVSGAVTAGVRQPVRDLAHPGSLRLIVTMESVGAVALTAWATWQVAGRLLRPVEEVRAELATIDFGGLHTHVSVPGSAQEIIRLCCTINNVLKCLHEAHQDLAEIAHRQRQFASEVSHELRNPIAGLRIQLEEAQQDPGRARMPELLGTTLDQVHRLQAITNDMLYLARLPTGTPAELRRLDLAAFVQAEISRRADRLPIRLHLTHGAIITAVPSQIGRLLANLLDNAQRHSTRLVRVEVRHTRRAVELAVSDDGPGIAAGDRERVFLRFTRLAEARRLDHNGTGLGLAIARDIALAHHGTLSVEESAAGGARFVLRLRRARPHAGGPA